MMQNPTVGDWAIVASGDIWYVCVCTTDGIWTLTEQEYDPGEINLAEYATKTELEDKQDRLIGGYNIKTINGTSVLGNGDIQIDIPEVPEVDLSNYYTKGQVDTLLAEYTPNTGEQKDYSKDIENLQSSISNLQTAIQNCTTEEEVEAIVERMLELAPNALETLQQIKEQLAGNSELVDVLNGILQTKADKNNVYTKEESDERYAKKGEVGGTVSD